MIGFFTTVGPREGDICVDTIRTVLRCYPDSKIWIRDDATSDGTFDVLQRLADSNTQQLDLVRNPSPMGIHGIPVSVFRTLQRICQAPHKLEMLIQLDPAVWLREGIVEFARNKFLKYGPGIIGSYTRSASQAVRSHSKHRNNMIRDLCPVGRDKASRKIRIGFPFYLSYLPEAIRGGYQLGHHVLGAFYIIHGDTLYALNSKGFWSSIPEAGSRSIKEDDPLVSLGAYIVGHKLIEIHDKANAKVWIQQESPLPLSARQIIERGYLAIHPLNNDEVALRIRAELQDALLAQKRCAQESAFAPHTLGRPHPRSKTDAELKTVEIEGCRICLSLA